MPETWEDTDDCNDKLHQQSPPGRSFLSFSDSVSMTTAMEGAAVVDVQAEVERDDAVAYVKHPCLLEPDTIEKDGLQHPDCCQWALCHGHKMDTPGSRSGKAASTDASRVYGTRCKSCWQQEDRKKTIIVSHETSSFTHLTSPCLLR